MKEITDKRELKDRIRDLGGGRKKEVDGKDIVGIRKALYEHISFDAMETAMTLAGLVCLILYGSPGRKKYNSINFYTGSAMVPECG